MFDGVVLGRWRRSALAQALNMPLAVADAAPQLGIIGGFDIDAGSGLREGDVIDDQLALGDAAFLGDGLEAGGFRWLAFCSATVVNRRRCVGGLGLADSIGAVRDGVTDGQFPLGGDREGGFAGFRLVVAGAEFGQGGFFAVDGDDACIGCRLDLAGAAGIEIWDLSLDNASHGQNGQGDESIFHELTSIKRQGTTGLGALARQSMC